MSSGNMEGVSQKDYIIGALMLYFNVFNCCRNIKNSMRNEWSEIKSVRFLLLIRI